MSWLAIFRLIVVWYVVVQLTALAVLPLTLRGLRALPDHGYSFAKISGVLLTGVFYWLAYSYGLLRNERGGAWVALLAMAVLSWSAGWCEVVAWWRTLRGGGRLRALAMSEAIFAIAFVAWAIVRAYDPNVDHTEEPMDLMFISSIWASPTYPPHDAWLAGYAISYYYLGYWLLATLARLANTLPSIAYNLGQAVWYGLLWVGCFGVVMNLISWRFGQASTLRDTASLPSGVTRIPAVAIAGGVLGGFVVAFIGNLQVILEWLYAQEVNISGLASFVDVHNFPPRASPTGEWFISYDWWWWRSSRVIKDLDLAGNYTDVIDEFPMFSYLLGDNHPHVMAMPVVLLLIALALNLHFLYVQRAPEMMPGAAGGWRRWLPLGWGEVALIIVTVGSLVFLNTWDFPPYWLLLVAVTLLGSGGAWRRAAVLGAVLFLGTIVVYLPYFLTAQSQASGILPNLFNPTHLPQFLIVFGAMLPAVAAVLLWGWRLAAPRWNIVGLTALVVLGVPLAFLAVSATLTASAWGQARLVRMPLPEGVSSYSQIIFERWLSAPWTLLFVGLLLTIAMATLVTLLQKPRSAWAGSADLVFVLLLGTIGLALVYAPEFVYLRDHFGTRMNTVFKFYYQGWLLMGLATAYLITVALSEWRRHFGVAQVLAVLSLLLVLGSAIFPFAGVYAKTAGFSRATPTLDAAGYVAQGFPDVMAAVEWVRNNTMPDEIVLEGIGDSYSANHNRISTLTGRSTLLGWVGHESQWRGKAYGTMAQGRSQVIEQVYRTASPEEIPALLEEWGINYVFVGPTEIEQYGITPFRLEELSAAMDTVFSRGQVHIFRRRAG